MPRARVTAVIRCEGPETQWGSRVSERVLASAEGLTGESMRFVLHSLLKQMDEAGIRELAAGNTELRTIIITTEMLE